MNKFNISILEKALMEIVKSLSVSNAVYYNRPKAASHQTDFVVVRVGSILQDMETFGTCRVYINLFAKDTESMKNNAKLRVMQEKIINGFPTSYDYFEGSNLLGSYLFDSSPNVVADKADDYGYHMRMINIETTIKSI